MPYDFFAEVFRGQRLNGREIEELTFGHTIHGRNYYGEEFGLSISADGNTALPTGHWNIGTSGTVRVESDDRLCLVYPTTEVRSYVFRNPGGTKTKENDYYLFGDQWGPFSQVD